MSAHLTTEDVRRAVDQMKDATYTACHGSDIHAIHPAAAEADLASCANCSTLVSPNGTWGLAPPTEESTVDPKTPKICPSCERPINPSTGECGCT